MPISYYLNALTSLFAAVALTAFVLFPKVQEGVVIKLGLGLMTFGLAATSVLILLHPGTDLSLWEGLWNAGLLTRVGLVVVVVGYWLKTRRVRHACRRKADWSVSAGAKE